MTRILLVVKAIRGTLDGLAEDWLPILVIIPNRVFMAVRNPYGLLPFRHLRLILLRLGLQAN